MDEQGFTTGDTSAAEATQDFDFTEAYTDTADAADTNDAGAQPESQQDAQQGAEEPFLKIKYLGNDENLTRERAIELAQKGRNYDHVAEELQKLRAEQETYGNAKRNMDALDGLAQRAGMDRESYIGFLQQQAEDLEVTRLIEEGIAEPMARQVFETQKREKENAAELERLKEELAERDRRDAARETWSAFFKAHPEVEGYDALPEEVRGQIAAGAHPENAYMAYRVKQLEQELAATKQNAKNAQTAAGSMQNEGPGEQLDAMQRAFMANFGG